MAPPTGSGSGAPSQDPPPATGWFRDPATVGGDHTDASGPRRRKTASSYNLVRSRRSVFFSDCPGDGNLAPPTPEPGGVYHRPVAPPGGGVSEEEVEEIAPEQVATRQDLGRELTALRARSGLTLRQLARRVDAPVATLGDYFAGRHLPGPAQLGLYRSILGACGVSDPGQIDQWIDALTRARHASDGRAAKTTAPYRGLEPFGESDHELFFGRRAATTELIERLQALADDPGPSAGVLLLMGPSGSGKSSLMAAGVVPAVRAGALDPQPPADNPSSHWDCVLPGGAEAALEAFETLARPAPGTTGAAAAAGTAAAGTAAAPGIATAAAAPGTAAARRTLLVLDQFEDVLALPQDSPLRRALLDHLADPPGRGHLVVATLRSDFYQAAAAEPALLPALRHAQALLGPMTEPELREAITGPALQGGAAVEEALVDLLLADLAPGRRPGFAHPAGALPFLSHVLLATWERAPRHLLTVADYRATDGIRGAVSRTAEDLYGSLTPTERALTRRIFSRLVRMEGDTPVTRRRISRRELDGLQDGEGGPDLVEGVLERFVAARLLTADETSIRISHDALLSAWPRLSEWIDVDRAGLDLHHQLSDATNGWLEADRDESLLWRGSRLDLAAEWLADPAHEDQLNRSERAFLAEAIAHRDAQVRATRLRARRMKQMLAAVATMALAVSALAGYALDTRSIANRDRDQALSREVAIEAQQVRASQPYLAAQLALAAYRISPTEQARSTLVDATAGDLPSRLLGPPGPTFVATDRDGRLMAVARSATDSVALYTVTPRTAGTAGTGGASGGTPHAAGQINVGPASVQNFAVALSPDGRLLATGGTSGQVTLWNVASPGHPALLATLRGMSSTVYSVAFDPAGRQMAAADADGHIYQWDVSDPRHPTTEPAVAAPGGAAMKAVAYSPKGGLAFAAGASGTLISWRPGRATATVGLGAGGSVLETLAVSPDGSTVVAGDDDGLLRVFSVAAGGAINSVRDPINVSPSRLLSAVFSPDGSAVVVGDAEGSVHLYGTRTWQVTATLEQADPVTGLAFGAGGTALVTADTQGDTEVWPVPLRASYGTGGSVYILDYSRDGKRLAAVSGGPQGRVEFWDTADPARPTRIGAVVPPASFGPVAGVGAVSPDGRLLAMGDQAAKIQLVDISNLERPRYLGAPLRGSQPSIEQMAFTPDGKTLVAGDDSGQLRLWDVADPSRPRLLASVTDTTGEVLGLSVSPDDHLLADAASDNKIRLYDITDPAHPRRLATLSGFTNYGYTTTFSPDSRTLIAGSADQTVRLWDVSHPAQPRPLGGPLTGPTGYVYQLDVSPDGHTLAAATTHQEVWLWDITNPAHPVVLDKLTAALDEVFAVAFSPKGTVLAATGSDSTLHFWDYQPATAAAVVCRAGGDGITRAEWSLYVQGRAYSPPCPT